MALSDAQRKALFGDDDGGQTTAAKPPPPPTKAAPAATPPSPSATTPPQPDQRPWDQRLDDLVPSWLKPSAGVRNYATAATGGAYQGLGDIATNLGLNTPPLPPDAQDIVNKYPTTAGIGHAAGAVAGTAPVVAATEGTLPFIGAAARSLPWLERAGGYVPRLVQWGARGGAAGAEQNVLAGDPNEPASARAEWGAATGVPLGILGGKVGDWFGASRTLDPEIANAGKVLQREGIDISSSNVPEDVIGAKGARPDLATGRQIDSATGRVVGQTVPDWSNQSLATAKTNIGGAVSAAANSGKITADPAFVQGLDKIQQQAVKDQVGNQITPLINDIKSHIQNGEISGADFDKLVGNGSPLHDLVANDEPYVRKAAQSIDKTMDDGFKAASPAGAYDKWVDARTNYRLLGAIEKNVVDGHINPGALFNDVRQRFPDLKSLTPNAASAVSRMGELAGAVRKFYGGGNAPAAPSSGFWPAAARTFGETFGIGTGVEAANRLMSGHIPFGNYPLAAAVPAGVAATAGAVRGLGRAYQNSSGFVNRLIARGGEAAGNRLVLPLLSQVGTQIAPEQRWRP